MSELQTFIKEFEKIGRTIICFPTDDLAEQFERYLITEKITYDVEIEKQCIEFIKQ